MKSSKKGAFSSRGLAADAKKAAVDLNKLRKGRRDEDLTGVDAAIQILSAATKAFAARYERGREGSAAALPAQVSVDLAEAVELLDTSKGAVAASSRSRAVEFALSTSVKMLAAMGAGNECRMAQPFEPLRIVRKKDGSMVWLCDHDPPHETPL